MKGCFAMSTNLRNFTRALYGMDAVMARVPSSEWDSPSPCAGWTARDVVAHEAGIMQAMSEMVQSGEMVLPEIPACEDPPTVWADARDQVLEALDQPGVLQREGGFWFGSMSVDDLIGFVQWDPLTHSWDIAAATGTPCVIDEDLLRLSFDRTASLHDPLVANKQINEVVTVPDGAHLIDRYLAMTGRDPEVGRATTVIR
jgi:uncharacterized protein (TIGR03086 family)